MGREFISKDPVVELNKLQDTLVKVEQLVNYIKKHVLN